MAEGVFMEDVITFCKCDYLVILRRNTDTEPGVDFAAGFKNVYQKALKNLGKGYDFRFDFSNIGNLSCTELVYVCNDDFLDRYQVKLKSRRVLFSKRNLLIPDDFITQAFQIVFVSQSVGTERLQKIINKNTSYNG